MMRETPREVLLLTPDLHGADGISLIARQIARAVTGVRPEVSFETWVFNDEDRRDLAEQAVPGRVRSARGGRARIAAWALGRAARDARDLLVIVNHVHMAPLAWPLVVRGARLVVYLHGVEAWRPIPRPQARMLNRASALIAHSQHTISNFRAANPRLAPLPVVRCPPGIQAVRQPSASAARRRDSDELWVLTVGRLWAEERYKGHDELIDIWPRVLSAVPAARLLIVGDGDDRGRLEQRAADPAVHGSVTLLGRVSREALEGLYAACDLFAMPSRREGFGLVFLEAMSAGKPCLGAFGAAEEVIVPGLSGVLVDPTHPQDLLEAVVRLLRDPTLRRRFGHAGQQRFEAEFTDERFAARLLAALGLTIAADKGVSVSYGVAS
jgi:glycosyltransferase involved in cell wall biosynthesis